MSSEFLASGENVLDSNLGGAWDIINGYAGRKQDLGIARRFGGSAAAYSLRDIGAMNGRVVKVRRDLDGEEADPEEDFSANQVQSGALEDWVNGKLESTLPADVATAAAAYSLRKVKASYSGDAVRIRRSSDDIEVDVAFDSDDKVSASSSITNIAEQGGESGSTTATDLNGFLNETLTVGTAVNGTGGFDNYTLTNVSNTGFSADNSAGGTGSAGFPYKHATGDVMVIRYTVSNFSSTSSLSPVIRGTTGVGSVVGTTTGGTEILANGTRTETLTATAEGTHLMFADGNTGSYTISDFEIVSHTHLAFVHTWYDQAGSYNAVQETDANQPKIAESGALLTDGIDFDGSNDFLGFGADICSNINNFSAFTIAKSDGGNGGLQVLFSVGFSGDGTIFAQARDDSNIEAHFGNGSSSANVVNLSQNVSQFESDMLFTTIGGSSTSKGFADAVEGGSVSSASANPTNTTGGIGMHTGSSSPFDGSVKEAIFYNSDQSDNRFKIESNINNYYGLYNDANETNGDFDKTFSPTADGTFTPNGKDGFTLAVVSSTVYAGIKLNADVTSGDSIYVSFNCSFDAGSPSPKIVLRDTDSDFFGGGTLMSNEESVVNGFNSFTLTSTNSSASGVVLSEADNNLTYSISDFKVSRIARNGFVETWYDQSGNGRDISQASASNQPTIVSNGGIYKSGAYPSIRYTDTSATYLVTESYSPVEQGGSGMPNFTLFAVTGIPEAAGFDSIVSAGGSEGSNSIGGFKLRHLKDGSGNIDSRIDIAQTGASPHQANAQSNNATPQSVNLHTSYLDSTDDELFAQQNSATSGTTTTTLIPLSGQGAENDNLKVGTDMFNDTPRASYLGEILEIILYTDSKKSDLSDLTSEINNFYNI